MNIYCYISIDDFFGIIIFPSPKCYIYLPFFFLLLILISPVFSLTLLTCVCDFVCYVISLYITPKLLLHLIYAFCIWIVWNKLNSTKRTKGGNAGLFPYFQRMWHKPKSECEYVCVSQWSKSPVSACCARDEPGLLCYTGIKVITVVMSNSEQ